MQSRSDDCEPSTDEHNFMASAAHAARTDSEEDEVVEGVAGEGEGSDGLCSRASD